MVGEGHFFWSFLERIMGFGVEVGKDREEEVRYEGLRKRNLGKSGEYKKIWGNKALNMTEEWT